jgi:hypothetical protein
LTAAELDGLLVAHAFLRVERPPQNWAPSSELEPFVRLLGELISAGLVRNSGELGELTLNVSNVTVEPEAADPIPAGDFVAVSIRGAGDWAPEVTWPRDDAFVSPDLPAAAAAAGAAYGYTRVLADGGGSVTVLVPRSADTSQIANDSGQDP